MARPSSFKPEYVEQAKKLCRLGATDADLADFFGVTFQTINNWKVQFPDFFESLKLSKAEADQRVEQSLYQRAMGYSCNEDDIRVVNNEIVITPTIKHYPPDTTAMIFWLKNRKPAEWRDKQDVDLNANLRVTDMTDDEIDKKLEALERGSNR